MEIKDEELLLSRKDQRLIFVANHYRKEVTSTVLWLLNHDVRIQCYRAISYSLGEDVFLQVEQIIPLPETAEFIIDIKEKEIENKNKSKTVEQTKLTLIKSWSLFKARLKDNRHNYLERVGAPPSFSVGFAKHPGRFGFCIGRNSYRVKL